MKLVAFDLDNTIVNLSDIHKDTLNSAIKEIVGEKYIISEEDHKYKYNGLPTTKKLEMMNFKQEEINFISRLKQILTIDKIHDVVREDKEKTKIFQYCNFNKIKIAIVSNAIKHTVEIVLKKMELYEYVDFLIHNKSTEFQKPHPQPYLYAMFSANIGPKDTIIFEDSSIGLRSAWDSSAHVIKVKDASELTFDFFEEKTKWII